MMSNKNSKSQTNDVLPSSNGSSVENARDNFSKMPFDGEKISSIFADSAYVSRSNSFSETKNIGKPKIVEKDEFVLWSDEESDLLEREPLSRSFAKYLCNSKNKEDSISQTTVVPDENKIDSITSLKDEAIFSCPICCKKNLSTPSDAFVSHLKSCASRNNISTEQLLKAVELHRKQVNERTALGLPNLRKASTVRRSTKKGIDLNLELGIALSASLRESEIMEKVRETETLLEAGLENEALSQCKKLEDFGYITPRFTNTNSSLKYSHRQKNVQNSILYTRSQEERERIITEKIAIILVDGDTPCERVPTLNTRVYDLKSKLLKKYLDVDSTLWKKSHHSTEHNGNDVGYYYCKNLSTFVSPCKLSAGAKLRHVSQIPYRHPSPVKTSIKNSSIAELAKIYSQQELNGVGLENRNPDTINSTVAKTNEHLKLSQAWKSFVNERALSDLMIYAKNEKLVYAHKLVLLVRCPTILSETIKESEDIGKCTDMLIWLDYDYETVIVFLEYLYSGDLTGVNKLTEKQRMDLKVLSSNYDVVEVETAVDEFDHALQERVSLETNDALSDICKLRGKMSRMTEGERNLHLLELELQSPTLDSSATSSVEMFGSEHEETNDQVELSSLMQEIASNSSLSPKYLDKFRIQFPEESVKRKSPSSPEENNVKKSKLRNEYFHDPKFAQTSSQSEKTFSFGKVSYDIFEKNKAGVNEGSGVSPEMNQNNYERNESKDRDTFPYVSPVWDGFEETNCSRFEYEYPIEIGNRLGSALTLHSPEKRSNEPFFESFDINTSELDRLLKEEVGKTQSDTSCRTNLYNATPQSTRKLEYRSKLDNALTPVSKVSEEITPMADYSNMKTKELKKELDKYGLKPGIERNKAKRLLRYIYDQLHPYETDTYGCPGRVTNSNVSTAGTSGYGDICNEKTIDDDKDRSSDECSMLSSGVELLEETFQDEDAIVCSQDLSQSSRVNLDAGFRCLMRTDENLYRKILLYEPLWLESLKTSLKEMNVKCNVNELMNFLDEKCITFRTRQTRYKRRRKMNTISETRTSVR